MALAHKLEPADGESTSSVECIVRGGEQLRDLGTSSWPSSPHIAHSELSPGGE